MASSATNAQAAGAESSEPASDGGRRVTQTGPLRVAPVAAVGVGGVDCGDGFVAAARCSRSGGWRTGLGPYS